MAKQHVRNTVVRVSKCRLNLTILSLRKEYGRAGTRRFRGALSFRNNNVPELLLVPSCFHLFSGNAEVPAICQ